MKWFFYKLELQHEFLGGYQYLDNCGKILSIAETEHNYLSSGGDTKKATIEKPEDKIVGIFSPVSFQLAQEEPSDSGTLLLKEFCSLEKLIFENIKPNSLNFTRCSIETLFPVESEENIFQIMSSFDNPLFNQLSKTLSRKKLLENINFMFRTGSVDLECQINGLKCSEEKNSKVMSPFFATDKQKSITERRNNKKANMAGKDFSFAIMLSVSATDRAAIFPCQENNWHSVIENNFKISKSSTEIIQKELEKCWKHE